MKSIKIIPAIFMFFLAISCSNITDPQSGNIDDLENFFIGESYAQKGPLVAGSKVVLHELDSQLKTTGVTYQTEIKGENGSFEITSSITSPYILIIATGRFISEITGEIQGPVTLELIAKTDSSLEAGVTVNVLTTIANKRILYLYENENLQFDFAKAQAQREIVSSFGFDSTQDEIEGVGFETMNVLFSGPEHEMLFEISQMVLQLANEHDSVDEVIYKIANDLANDVVLDSIAEDSLYQTLQDTATFDNSFSNFISPAGQGTQESPFEISNFEQLKWIYENRQVWDGFFIQTANIDAVESQLLDDGFGWNPIGDSLTPFSGVYNGAGFFISNLFVNRPNTDYIGFFGYIAGEEAKVENLGIVDVDIVGKDHVGALAGFFQGSAFSRCYSVGSVYGASIVGHLVGAGSGEIELSYSIGDVEAQEVVAGGLAGSGEFMIFNSYSFANVKATIDAGGLVGNSFYQPLIENSYSAGELVVEEESLVGGLIGSFLNFGSQIITNSYWDVEVSQYDAGLGGVGKTTQEMKEQTTFENWDFENIWAISQDFNDGYPYLQYQRE